MMDLLPFGKSVSRPRIVMLAKRRQRLKKGFSTTRSALFSTNGCATGSKQRVFNSAKASGVAAALSVGGFSLDGTNDRSNFLLRERRHRGWRSGKRGGEIPALR